MAGETWNQQENIIKTSLLSAYRKRQKLLREAKFDVRTFMTILYRKDQIGVEDDKLMIDNLLEALSRQIYFKS